MLCSVVKHIQLFLKLNIPFSLSFFFTFCRSRYVISTSFQIFSVLTLFLCKPICYIIVWLFQNVTFFRSLFFLVVCVSVLTHGIMFPCGVAYFWLCTTNSPRKIICEDFLGHRVKFSPLVKICICACQIPRGINSTEPL